MSRGPLNLSLLVAAATFALFMVVELAIYGKGIGRALWVSGAAALVLFLVAFVYLRASKRAASS